MCVTGLVGWVTINQINKNCSCNTGATASAIYGLNVPRQNQWLF